MISLDSSQKIIKVGFSVEDITPPQHFNARLGGYLRFFKHATGVHHPLKARAICFKNDKNIENSMILISIDLLGAQYRMTKVVRRIISRKTKIPIKNIMLHFTHTHTGPDTVGIFPNKLNHFLNTDVEYPVFTYIFRRVIKAALDSVVDATRLCKIGFGETISETKLSRLREPPFGIIEAPIRFIKITNLEESKTIALLVNYQAHPTQLPQINTILSSEYPGQVAEYLMKTKPDLEFAAYFNGAIGNVSTSGRGGYFWEKYTKYLEEQNLVHSELVKNHEEYLKVLKLVQRKKLGKCHEFGLDSAFKAVDEYAKAFGDFVLDAESDVKMEPITALYSSRKFMFQKIGRSKSLLPRLKHYNSLKDKHLIVLKELKNKIRMWLLADLYKLINGRSIPMLNIIKNGAHDYHQTEIQMFKINDINWLSAPGEPFYEYQDELLNKKLNGRGFFNSMGNDTCGYIFPWRFYVQGGYEVGFSFDMFFGRDLKSNFLGLIRKSQK